MDLATPVPATTAAGPSRPASRGGSVALLLVGWAALAWGISSRDGRYNPLGLALVGLGGGCVAAALLVRPRRAPRAVLTGYVVVALLVGVAPLVWHPRYYASGPAFTVANVLVAIAGPLAAATVLAGLLPAVRARLGSGDRLFVAALALATGAGIAMVIAAPEPRIDVFALLQGSTRGLEHGADMYRQQWGASRATYRAGGLFDVYPYLPGTSLLLLPFRLLFGDVRYGLLAALALAALLVRRIGRGGGGRAPALLPLLVALYPKVTYADQQAWTEPLLVCALAGMVWAVGTGRGRVAVLCLAAALASKQHIVLLLPLAAGWPAFGPRRTAWATGLAALVVAPWVIAGPRDFWHDAVTTNLDYPVLDHSLSLAALLHHWGWSVGFGLTAVALVAAYWLAWRRRGDAFGFCAGSALVMVALDLTNKQSFFNHYTLVMGLLVLAVASAPVSGWSRTAPASSPPAAPAGRPAGCGPARRPAGRR